MCYTQALFAFRKSGDSEVARKAVAEAWEYNSHVSTLLARRGRIRFENTGYYTLGGEDEAAYYLEEYGLAWKETPGAVDWLVEIIQGPEAAAEGPQAGYEASLSGPLWVHL